jgi:hypothetical protein
MDDERRQRMNVLLDRIEALLVRLEPYKDPNAPRWRRVVGAYRRVMILRRVDDLMDEYNALNGKVRPAQKWLGMGRAGWLRFQFGIGVVNAWSGVDSAADGNWLGAFVSFACVIITAHWRLPYAPPRLH